MIIMICTCLGSQLLRSWQSQALHRLSTVALLASCQTWKRPSRRWVWCTSHSAGWLSWGCPSEGSGNLWTDCQPEQQKVRSQVNIISSSPPSSCALSCLLPALLQHLSAWMKSLNLPCLTLPYPLALNKDGNKLCTRKSLNCFLEKKSKISFNVGSILHTLQKNPHEICLPLYFPRRRKREEDISWVQHQESKK